MPNCFSAIYYTFLIKQLHTAEIHCEGTLDHIVQAYSTAPGLIILLMAWNLLSIRSSSHSPAHPIWCCPNQNVMETFQKVVMQLGFWWPNSVEVSGQRKAHTTQAGGSLQGIKTLSPSEVDFASEIYPCSLCLRGNPSEYREKPWKLRTHRTRTWIQAHIPGVVKQK